MGELHEACQALQAMQCSNLGRPASDASDRLHSRILWNTWSLVEGGEEELRARYVLRRQSLDGALMMRSDEFSAYRQGLRSLSLRRRKHLALQHPQLEAVLKWPFAALSHREWDMRTVVGWNRLFTSSAGLLGVRYSFPGDTASTDENRLPVMAYGLDGLYQRGDIYGFLMLACAYRLFHLQRLADRQWYAASHMIRALSGACRDPRVRPYAHELITQTKQLLRLLPDTSFPIHVNDDVIWDQIRNDVHEPSYLMRRAAERRGVHIPEPVSPIISYRYQKCAPHQQPLLFARNG